MAPSGINGTQHFAGVKRSCEYIEASQVQDFLPQALVGQPACHDQLWREGHLYQSIAQRFPVAIRQITFDDHHRGGFCFERFHCFYATKCAIQAPSRWTQEMNQIPVVLIIRAYSHPCCQKESFPYANSEGVV